MVHETSAISDESPIRRTWANPRLSRAIITADSGMLTGFGDCWRTDVAPIASYHDSGTGAFQRIFNWIPEPTGSSVFLDVGSISEYESAATLASVQQLLVEIQSTFSLRLTEMSAILRVQRPTVYAWLKQESDPNQENYERICAISEFVAEWRRYSSDPLGTLVRQSSEGSASLMELLKKARLQKTSITECLHRLATHSSRLHSGGRRPRRMFESVTQQAQRAGFDLSTVSENSAVFDVVTGKRMHEE